MGYWCEQGGQIWRGSPAFVAAASRTNNAAGTSNEMDARMLQVAVRCGVLLSEGVVSRLPQDMMRVDVMQCARRC